MSKPLKVCFVAHPLAGKDVAMLYVAQKYNMKPVSTGDYIRKYVTEHKLGDTSPQNLNVVSIGLRQRYGPEFPIPQILLENKDVPRIALSGPRVFAEVDMLKKHDTIIVAVEATLEARYARTKIRKRIGDDVTFEEFVRFQKLEASNEDMSCHNVNYVIRMADYWVRNDGSLEEFHFLLDQLMATIDPQ